MRACVRGCCSAVNKGLMAKPVTASLSLCSRTEEMDGKRAGPSETFICLSRLLHHSILHLLPFFPLWSYYILSLSPSLSPSVVSHLSFSSALPFCVNECFSFPFPGDNHFTLSFRSLYVSPFLPLELFQNGISAIRLQISLFICLSCFMFSLGLLLCSMF